MHRLLTAWLTSNHCTRFGCATRTTQPSHPSIDREIKYLRCERYL